MQWHQYVGKLWVVEVIEEGTHEVLCAWPAAAAPAVDHYTIMAHRVAKRLNDLMKELGL